MRLVVVGGDSPGVIAIGPQSIGIFAAGPVRHRHLRFRPARHRSGRDRPVVQGSVRAGAGVVLGQSARPASSRSACWPWPAIGVAAFAGPGLTFGFFGRFRRQRLMAAGLAAAGSLLEEARIRITSWSDWRLGSRRDRHHRGLGVALVVRRRPVAVAAGAGCRTWPRAV